MRNTKLLAWPMVLMLGLLSTGVAYAHWSQMLYIEGSVASGSLDWEFTDVSAEDDVLGELDYNCRDNFEGPPPLKWRVDKDVGRTTAIITDSHTITVTLTNVYPSYWTEVSVYAHNTGTIPLIIDNVIINGNVLRKSPTSVVGLDLSSDGLNDIEIWWGDGFGTQLEHCERSPEMSFWIHVLQDAPQGATLSFTIELVAVQYNLYDPPKP